MVQIIKKAISILACLMLLSASITVFAAGPSTINYEGYLTNSSGAPQNGTAQITVRIYDSPTGGNLLFEEVHPGITIANGYFTVIVGSVGDVSSSTTVGALSELPFNSLYYITTEIGSPYNTGEMKLSGGARAPISLAPYAYTASAIPTHSTMPGGSLNVGEVFYNTTNNTMYIYDGTNWNPQTGGIVTSSNILDGTVALSDMANDSIDSSKILNGAVSGADIGANTVGLSNIQRIGGAKLLGNGAGDTGDITEIGLGTGLAFASGDIGLDTSVNADWTGAHTLTNQNGILLKAFSTTSGDTTPLRFAELPSNGANYVGFKAPDSVASNTTWTLPSTDGASGEILSTNGSGVLSWATALKNGGNAIGGTLNIGTTDAQALAFNTNNTEVMRLGTSGNLGIGTTSLSERLTVNGGNMALLNNGSNPTYIAGDADSAGNYGYMQWDSNNDILNLGTQAAGTAIRMDENGKISFNNSNINNTGRVLVKSSSGDNNVMSLSRSENSGSGMGYITFRRNDNTELAYISCNLSGLSCSLVNASDRRVKQDIQDSSSGLDDVMKLGVKDYSIIGDDTGSTYQGFIAQDLINVYPQAVARGDDNPVLTPDGKMWGVDYGRITPLLARAIQQQQVILTGSDLALLKSSDDVTLLRNESSENVSDTFAERLTQEGRVIAHFVAGTVSAVRGYFEQIDTNNVTAQSAVVQSLCVGTNSEKTCLNKAQIDDLVKLLPQIGKPSVNSTTVLVQPDTLNTPEPNTSITNSPTNTSNDPSNITSVSQSTTSTVSIDSSPVTDSTSTSFTTDTSTSSVPSP